MTKFSKILVTFLMALLVPNCSQVLQTIKLELDIEDNSIQENFSVVEKVLTFKEAKTQNKSPYNRTILLPGRGDSARHVAESIAMQSTFPEEGVVADYKIGIGDILAFSKLIDNDYSNIKTQNIWPDEPISSAYKLGIGDTLALTLMKDEETLNRTSPVNRMSSSNGNDNQSVILNSSSAEPTINTTGRVGSDGSVLLLEVGRLEASGKSLNELRSEVRNILIRNGVSPRFQLEIVQFESNRAYMTVSSDVYPRASHIITLKDQKTTLIDVLTSTKIAFRPGVMTNIKLQRGNKIYTMNLRDVFSEAAPEVIIQDRDHIFVQDSSSSIVTSSTVVGADGKIVLAGVVSIKAA